MPEASANQEWQKGLGGMGFEGSQSQAALLLPVQEESWWQWPESQPWKVVGLMICHHSVAQGGSGGCSSAEYPVLTLHCMIPSCLVQEEKEVAAAVVGLLEGGLPALRAKALLAGALMARTNPRAFLLSCKSKLLVQVQLGPAENRALEIHHHLPTASSGVQLGLAKRSMPLCALTFQHLDD